MKDFKKYRISKDTWEWIVDIAGGLILAAVCIFWVFLMFAAF